MNKMLPDLVIEFEEIDEPTIFPDEAGKVKVVVTNQSFTTFTEPLKFDIYASTDSVLDLPLNEGNLSSTDELLGTLDVQRGDLGPWESQTFSLDFADPELRTPSVVSPGAYYLLAKVDPRNDVVESNETNNVISTFVSTSGTDVVLDWNSTLFNAIQANKIKLARGNPEAVATIDSRNVAIVHAAIYDAVNAIDQSHSSYFLNTDPFEVAGASPEAAVVGAAYQTLINLYPGEAAAFEAQQLRSLAEIPDGAAEEVGFNLGVDVANQILELRKNDGLAEAVSVAYTVEPVPGVWRPTPTRGITTPNFGKAVLPGISKVTPFGISSIEDILQGIQVDGPPSLDSAQYAAELEQVRLLGGLENTDVTKITRTPEQTEIAKFWSYDRSNTFGEPYNLIAQDVALQQSNTLAENARLFAVLNFATADAALVAFDLKYTYNQWRPITGIQEADTDGNPNTIKDWNWEPLLDNPSFPDYIAAHSVLGAAAAEILASFYGTDNIKFSVPSQELPGVARSFGSFSEFAKENSISRLYGGVHLASSSEDGLIVGAAVGDYVFNNVLI